jgi:hypothetical protein
VESSESHDAPELHLRFNLTVDPAGPLLFSQIPRLRAHSIASTVLIPFELIQVLMLWRIEMWREMGLDHIIW